MVVGSAGIALSSRPGSASVIASVAALVTSAFTLLAKYFSQKRSIIHFANEVQLLQDDQEVTIFKKVLHQVREMKKQAEVSEFWMGVADDKDAFKKSRNFITQLEMLTDLCVHNPDRIVDFDVKKKKKK